jgi:hypothetical protein
LWAPGGQPAGFPGGVQVPGETASMWQRCGNSTMRLARCPRGVSRTRNSPLLAQLDVAARAVRPGLVRCGGRARAWCGAAAVPGARARPADARPRQAASGRPADLTGPAIPGWRDRTRAGARPETASMDHRCCLDGFPGAAGLRLVVRAGADVAGGVPGAGSAGHDQLKLSRNTLFRVRATPHGDIRLHGFVLQPHRCGTDVVPGGADPDSGRPAGLAGRVMLTGIRTSRP